MCATIYRLSVTTVSPCDIIICNRIAYNSLTSIAKLLQVSVIEFVLLAIDFVPLANKFVLLAIE